MCKLASYRTSILALLCVLVSSGCIGVQEVVGPTLLEGGVEALHPGTTLWGLTRVVSGGPHAIRMMSPDGLKFLFGFPTMNGWGFVPIDMTAKQMIKDGCFTSCKSMADLVTTLTTSGWTFVDVEAIPPALVQAVQTGAAWVTQLSTLPFLVLPADVEGPLHISPESIDDFWSLPSPAVGTDG